MILLCIIFAILLIFTPICLSIFRTKTKENLTLTKYSSLYVDSIQKSSASLTSESVTKCNIIQNDVIEAKKTVDLGIRPISIAKEDITDSKSTLVSQINLVNDTKKIQKTTLVGLTSYNNANTAEGNFNIGILQTYTLISINIKGIVSSSIAKPYIQFIFKMNNETTFYTSNIIYISGVFDKTITTGNSNSYIVEFPVTIPKNTHMYIVISPNTRISSVSISLLYHDNPTTNSLYDLKTSVYTSILNDTCISNKFNYNMYSKYGINNDLQKSVKIDPRYSILNTAIIPDVQLQDTLYLNSNASYNSTYSKLNIFNNTINSIKDNLSFLKTYLDNILVLKNSLNDILNYLNSKLSISTDYYQIAQKCYDNTNNYSNVTAIQLALGETYTNAKLKLDNSIISKNKADDALQKGINDKVSDIELDKLIANKNNAQEEYENAYQAVRFLLDPSNLVNDIPSINEVINLNTELNSIEAINTFLKYFIENNIDLNNSKIFYNLSSQANNGSYNIIDTKNSIIDSFEEIVPVVKKKNISISTDSLNICKTSKDDLEILIKTINSSIADVTDVITSTNLYIDDVTTFLEDMDKNISNYNTILDNININLLQINKYKVEYFYKPEKYSNWDYGKVYTGIGTIKNTGKLIKLYLFANMYCWDTCIQAYTYFKIGITKNNSNKTLIYNTSSIFITSSPDMTLEFLFSPLNVNVEAGDIVNIFIAGSVYLSCAIESRNVQLKLDIQTP